MERRCNFPSNVGRDTHTDWWEELMKYAVEMALDATVCIPGFTVTDSRNRKIKERV
jgi:hypothetical protein